MTEEEVDKVKAVLSPEDAKELGILSAMLFFGWKNSTEEEIQAVRNAFFHYYTKGKKILEEQELEKLR